MSSTDDLIAILASELPMPVYDGAPPRSITGEFVDPPHRCVCVYGGVLSPHNRRYGGTSRSRSALWQLVCCNSSSEGARIVAGLVTDALDATILNGNLLAVLAVSAPLEDRDDPSEYRWSSTVEVSHYSPA